jgi:hypothetical protein
MKITNEQRISKLIEKVDERYSGLESLNAADVKEIIRHSFHVGRKAGFLECKDNISALYKAKFKHNRESTEEVSNAFNELNDYEQRTIRQND